MGDQDQALEEFWEDALEEMEEGQSDNSDAKKADKNEGSTPLPEQHDTIEKGMADWGDDEFGDFDWGDDFDFGDSDGFAESDDWDASDAWGPPENEGPDLPGINRVHSNYAFSAVSNDLKSWVNYLRNELIYQMEAYDYRTETIGEDLVVVHTGNIITSIPNAKEKVKCLIEMNEVSPSANKCKGSSIGGCLLFNFTIEGSYRIHSNDSIVETPISKVEYSQLYEFQDQIFSHLKNQINGQRYQNF